ncbi:hypothetical protein [Actibacterium sp.]
MAVLSILPHRHPVDMDLLRDLFEGWKYALSIEARIQSLPHRKKA